MSFCGMALTCEGIVCFTDSKSTVKNWLGIEIEEPDRGFQKIIMNNDLILVSIGTNRILNKFNNYVGLDDMLKIIINDYLYRKAKKGKHDMDWLCKSLQSIIQKTVNKNSNNSFEFLVGYKEDGYKVVRMIINREQQKQYELKTTHNEYCQYEVIGDEVYCHLFKDLCFDKNYSFHKLSDILKEIVENMIEINDLSRDYNPAGLPVKVKVFQ